MFIIFDGWGLLVIVFGIIAVGIGVAANDYLGVPITLAPYLVLGIWALQCVLFGRWVNSGKRDRVLFDQRTSEEVVLKDRHSLFFIQIEYWAIPILMLAAYWLYLDIKNGYVSLDALPSLAKLVQAPATGDASKPDDLSAANEAYEHEHYADALAIYQPAAERGNSEAQFYMGLMYLRGLGLPQDYGKAIGWFRKSAAQGEVGSEVNIGVMYENGFGVEKDDRKALDFYRKAAEAGSATAQYNVGAMYLYGRGTAPDRTEALKWFGKAAEQGSDEAKQALADTRAAIAASPVYQPGKFNIVFTGAEAQDFQNGRAQSCALIVNVHNNTKHHVDKISFRIEDWTFELGGEMNANTYADGYAIQRISLSNDTVCSDQAAFIQRSASKAAVFDCDMPGLAEGDCQDLVAISNAIDAGKVKQIADLERSLGARQIAPLRDAIAKAGLNIAFTTPIEVTSDRLAKWAVLLDTIVKIDSQSWSYHKYSQGSMRNITVVSQLPNISSIEIKGFYLYWSGNQQATGWVVATFRDGALKCLQFHDFANECRRVRLPDVSADGSPPR